MKKLFKLLMLTILVVPFIVKADMGAPVLEPYEAYVIAEGGATVYKFNPNTQDYDNYKEYEKGTKITVQWETGYKGLVSFTDPESDYNWLYILVGDISPVKESVVPSDLKYSYKVEGTLKVLKEGGVDIKKGPAEAYGNAGKLPQGLTIKPSYQSNSEGRWYYVEYEGAKGWVQTEGTDVVWVENSFYYFVSNASMLDNPNARIHDNSLVKAIYCTDVWGIDDEIGDHCYFETNDAKGWTSVFKQTYTCEIGPADTEIKEVEFIKDYVVKYNMTSTGQTTEFKKGDTAYLLTKNCYTDYNSWSESTIPILYKDGVYYSPYTIPDDLSSDGLPKEIAYTGNTKKLGEVLEQPVEEPTTDVVVTPDEDKKEENKIPTKDLIIICSIVGGVVALTAIVVIILINKRKKNKKKAEETPVETVQVAETTEPVVQEEVQSTEPAESTLEDVTDEFKKEDTNEEVK